jgi:hypothetical protein
MDSSVMDFNIPYKKSLSKLRNIVMNFNTTFTLVRATFSNNFIIQGNHPSYQGNEQHFYNSVESEKRRN